MYHSKKRSFLGVTFHLLNKNLNRESAALACRRFSGTHLSDRIGEMLEEVHTQFIQENFYQL